MSICDEEVWLRAYTANIAGSTHHTVDACATLSQQMADKALEAFHAKFPSSNELYPKAYVKGLDEALFAATKRSEQAEHDLGALRKSLDAQIKRVKDLEAELADERRISPPPKPKSSTISIPTAAQRDKAIAESDITTEVKSGIGTSLMIGVATLAGGLLASMGEASKDVVRVATEAATETATEEVAACLSSQS